jgi:molecular chaperone HscB
VESRSSSDFFASLGIEPRFDIDLAQLEAAFHARSAEVHPDRFASAPAAERVAALSRSMDLNQAYKTLKRPVPRAEYLLARAGMGIAEGEKVDAAFLAEVLELREELEDARAAAKLDEVARLERAMKARHDGLVAGLGPAFAKGDLAEARKIVIELRYVARYLEACDAALDEDAA